MDNDQVAIKGLHRGARFCWIEKSSLLNIPVWLAELGCRKVQKMRCVNMEIICYWRGFMMEQRKNSALCWGCLLVICALFLVGSLKNVAPDICFALIIIVAFCCEFLVAYGESRRAVKGGNLSNRLSCRFFYCCLLCSLAIYRNK